MAADLPWRVLAAVRNLVCAGVASLFVVVTFFLSSIADPAIVDIVVQAFLWTCGALGAVGLAGALVTANARWLWWILVGAAVAALAMLVALSRFNWGM